MRIEAPDVASAGAALFSQGQRFLLRRQVHQAIKEFDAAQRAGYPAHECAAGRWNCWMLLGDFEQAWQESDAIAAIGTNDPDCLWDGRSWNGQRVMLRCLHGLGDTIQFIRYAHLLKQTCRSITVQTHPELLTLLEGVTGVDRVCSWGPDYVENRSDWDMQMEVTELPRAFRTSLATIPASQPYIHVPQERIDWASSFFDSATGLRVGLCWESGPWDPARSMSLSDLTPLLSHPCRFFSLQKSGHAADSRILDLAVNSADVRDTAAFILNLDLVITVDTMIAHLAGALGRRVWLMLPAYADWRWMLERNDTPWYPNTRIFRQHPGSGWSGVIEDVRAALDRAI